VGLKLNGTHQLLVYADDVNLLEDNMDMIKMNTENLTEARKEVGLEVNVEKTKHMLMSRHQNAGQDRKIKIANTSFENVAQFNYSDTIVKNQNLIQEGVKRRLHLDKTCYHSVQKVTSSHLLPINVKTRIYITIILPVVLYGCETWSLPLREEHRLRVFEKRVLRRIFGPKRDEVIGGWRKLHNEELLNLYCSPSIIRMMK
jgi:hypothetical protein